MKITYNAKDNRKELVAALETLTGSTAVYLKAPTYAYSINDYVVNRDGDLVIPDDTDETVVDELLASLENLGFTYIAMQRDKTDLAPVDEYDEEETEESTDETETPEENEDSVETEASNDSVTETEDPGTKDDTAETKQTQVTLSFPVSLFAEDAIDRMKAIVASKASLLKKALDTDNLDIMVEGDKVNFPWFKNHGLEGEIDAYSKLAFAIARMAITQNRVTATEKQNPDEKLAMRLFLIRLNFIGDEYKSARAILMRNFDSHQSRKQADAVINLCMPEVTTSTTKETSTDE